MVMEKEENSSLRSPHLKDLTTILETLTTINGANVPLKLGVINYNKEISHDLEDELWGLLTRVDVVPYFLPLQQVNQTWKWEDFYPEWIDEEEVVSVPLPFAPYSEARTKHRIRCDLCRGAL
ncbi:hypothetical protein L7F22_011712 [Adiantum nelumboides]|nr:hypothetical protein [Adiantum nelumboides]